MYWQQNPVTGVNRILEPDVFRAKPKNSFVKTSGFWLITLLNG